ncbi:LysR family transcriptional regulator [Novosphingobium mathurense]|uniref:DNA-binding transcriptional regulator, LysR family n=1 Tax=Novosphingobium mathurense TaxID=428990 RepID=A0A1U6HUL2_9SPHN|nr:LysR family transcriptional regulator [Novosphingobium mathurense]SLJ99429.1 DNA-binding transcriptional regulator, LysR family [Novosphingobium mathurense]
MDNRFGEMEIFLSVAQTGSFAGAARMLRVTPSAVSRSISRLEARLGVQLVARTTRALALTADGETYRDRVTALMDELRDVDHSFGGEEYEARGLLRVNASVPFGTHCLLPILPRFLDRFPAVTVDLALSDALVELVAERADIAIRIGPLRDASLKAKKLGRSRMVVVASPDYLARHGEPTEPRDLDRHPCLRFSFRRSVDSWPFKIDGRVVSRTVDGPFLGNSGEVVRLMALASGGIARLAHFHIAKDLASGQLLELLPTFHPGDGEDIHALYLGEQYPSRTVRAFLDFLGSELVLPQ